MVWSRLGPGGDQYPYRIRLRQLQEIAKSPRNGGEDTVQKYYAWREGRALTASKGLAAAALSVLTAWLVPFLKNEYDGGSPDVVIVIPVALVLTLAIVGLISLLRMDRIHTSFIHAMVWLQRLR